MSEAERFLQMELDALLRPSESGDGFPQALDLLHHVADRVPAWRFSGHQSVDLQLAARDEQAIRDGHYLAVVGDSHPGANPLFQGVFAHRHPAPARFRAL